MPLFYHVFLTLSVLDRTLEAIKSAKSIGMTVCGVYDKSSQTDWEQIKQIADYSIIDFQNAPLV